MIMEIGIIVVYALSVLVGVGMFLYISYVVIVGIPQIMLRIPCVARFARRINKPTYRQRNSSDNEDRSINNPDNIPYITDNVYDIRNCFIYWFGVRPRQSNNANRHRDGCNNKSPFNSVPKVVLQKPINKPNHSNSIISRNQPNANNT